MGMPVYTDSDLAIRYMLTSNPNPINPSPNPATIVFTLPIHFQGIDPYRCGALRPGDLLKALAFVYSIQNLGPSNRFDVRTLLLDNCNNALRIDQDLFNLLSKGTLCNTQFSTNDNSVINASSVVAVHTLDSRFVVAANRITAPMKIQLTSSYATSPRLSDVRVYPYFARTVPPDTQQMMVIARLLQRLGWSYVSVLYTQEPYGIGGFRTLRDLTRDEGYSCIGFSEAIRDSRSKPDIKEALARMAEVEGPRVIVLIFVDNIRNVLESLIEMDLASRYVVIGTDAWGREAQVTDGIWNHFLGAMTIGFRDASHTGFLNWMRGITFTNRRGIPDSWFEEFYQRIHNCQLPNSQYRLTEFSTICREDLEFEADKISNYVGIHDIAAAYAIKEGLNRVRCTGAMTFAECMAISDNLRERLFAFTLNVDWPIPRGNLDPPSDFRLTLGDKRYWDVGYNIYTIKEANVYENVGSSGADFFFNSSYQTYRGADFSSSCPVNQFCDCNVDDDGFTQVIVNIGTSAVPRNYFMYEENSSTEKSYTWPIWAIAVAVLSCIGIVIGLILFFYFLVAYPVRGGTTILGFMMIVGCLGIYAINFAFFLPASKATCGAREFVLGVVYAIVFAALLIKAIDDWRFKDYDYRSKQYYRGISNPCFLITLATGIVLIQCIIPIEWLILKNPSASQLVGATDKHDWMACDPHDFYDISLVLSMVFVIFLVVLTAIFAALAWDSESNYYESRWIFVGCVCTAGCFLVWMVVSTNADQPYRDPAVAMANFFNASALLVLLPLRKLILLIQFKSEEEKSKLTNGAVESNTADYATVYHNQAYDTDNGIIIDGKTLPADEY